MNAGNVSFLRHASASAATDLRSCAKIAGLNVTGFARPYDSADNSGKRSGSFNTLTIQRWSYVPRTVHDPRQKNETEVLYNSGSDIETSSIGS